ncbi:SDR family NAD(P)-dependent oxidoreductase [Brevibacillus sp. TJ4]|uniref:SDR family NAD(P)-dependent oxidoreductase n=1 Tax=Brevibacillus sp. TJ4 TaxID=3234853 RepID=UPI0037D5A2BD
MRLEGKVAIVTGAGGGIGQEITNQLAQDGATVFAWDISEKIHSQADEMNQNLDAKRVIPVQIDISDIAQMRSKVEQIVEEKGKIDILVNNAGIMQTIPFLEIDEQSWDRMLDTNLKSVFFLTQAVVKPMMDRKQGRIINISSIAGRSGRPVAAHYAASKSAVLSLTKSAALAFGEHGIRVNAICPGVIMTPMMEQINRDRARIFGKENEENVAVNEFLAKVPIKEIGYPSDVAQQVVFLCLPESSYVHGQAINVCGGYEMN